MRQRRFLIFLATKVRLLVPVGPRVCFGVTQHRQADHMCGFVVAYAIEVRKHRSSNVRIPLALHFQGHQQPANVARQESHLRQLSNGT